MARDEEEQSSRGFKVDDRRRFVDLESGEPRTPAEEPREAVRPPETAEQEREPSPTDDTGPYHEMNFSSFIMGLTTQALMHLGEIADPVEQHVVRDLPAARQMIDLLGILREKTKGNLDPTEEQLLDNMLYDLRIRYVEVSRGQ